MRIFVIGASGGVGSRFVQQARAAGHTVTAFSRHPEALAGEGVDAVAGDATQAQPLGDAMAGHDAVAIAIGGGLSDRTTRHVATGHAIAAMQAHGIERVVAVSSLGAGDSYGRVGFATKAIMKTLLRNALKDHNAQEQALQASGLDYTILRPGGLTNDPTGHRVIDDPQASVPGGGRIGRDAVAEVALQALSEAKWSRQAVALVPA